MSGGECGHDEPLSTVEEEDDQDSARSVAEKETQNENEYDDEANYYISLSDREECGDDDDKGDNVGAQLSNSGVNDDGGDDTGDDQYETSRGRKTKSTKRKEFEYYTAGIEKKKKKKGKRRRSKKTCN